MTQCYPAEVFPTRFRATAHGISAAAGKAGAIISALVFNSLSKKIGTPAILWSTCCSSEMCSFLIMFLFANSLCRLLYCWGWYVGSEVLSDDVLNGVCDSVYFTPSGGEGA